MDFESMRKIITDRMVTFRHLLFMDESSQGTVLNLRNSNLHAYRSYKDDYIKPVTDLINDSPHDTLPRLETYNDLPSPEYNRGTKSEPSINQDKDNFNATESHGTAIFRQ